MNLQKVLCKLFNVHGPTSWKVIENKVVNAGEFIKTQEFCDTCGKNLSKKESII